MLYDLLFGDLREDTGEVLSAVLCKIADYLQEQYGESAIGQHAPFEIRNMARDLGNSADACTAKRAAVIFSLRERSIAAWFEQHGDERDRALVSDFEKRILPLISGIFVREQCQRPDSLLLMSFVFATMFPTEHLAPFPVEDAQSV